MTDSTRARVKDILTIGTLSIALFTGIGAASLRLLGVQTKEAAAAEHLEIRVDTRKEVDELRALLLETRHWSWCSLNNLTYEQCRTVLPPPPER